MIDIEKKSSITTKTYVWMFVIALALISPINVGLHYFVYKDAMVKNDHLVTEKFNNVDFGTTGYAMSIQNVKTGDQKLVAITADDYIKTAVGEHYYTNTINKDAVNPVLWYVCLVELIIAVAALIVLGAISVMA